MKRLTILVDMDDTIENLGETWVDFLNETHGTNRGHDEIREWDMSKAFPELSRDEVYQPLFEEEMWKRVKPLPGAVKYIKRLIDDGHKVVIVTSSHPDTVSMKMHNVLFKYFPFLSYKDVIIASQKQLVCGDILVDDYPLNLEGGKYLGILVTANHNKSYDAIAHGIVRADNWGEIYKTICELSHRL